jgi:hypothetical protein
MKIPDWLKRAWKRLVAIFISELKIELNMLIDEYWEKMKLELSQQGTYAMDRLPPEIRQRVLERVQADKLDIYSEAGKQAVKAIINRYIDEFLKIPKEK